MMRAAALFSVMLVLGACEKKAEPGLQAEAAVDAPAAVDAVSTPLAQAASTEWLEPGIPYLPQSGASAEAFTPKGWRLEHKTAGDINRDGRPDLVMVFQDQEPENIIANEGLGVASYNANRRMIGVALAYQDGFVLAAQNHHLIPVRDSPVMDDPLEAAPTIEKGVATITLTLFMSAGGSDAGSYKFRFRHEDNDIRLIGYDHDNVQRMSGKTSEVSVNFLTGRRVDGSGSIEDDKLTTKVSRTDFGAIPLEMVGDGFAFETQQLETGQRHPD